MFSLHQCQALHVALALKCHVGIATCILFTLVSHGESALHVHTNITKLVRRLAVQRAELQAASLNVYVPCCVVRRSCDAQGGLFYKFDSLCAMLAPYLML